MTWHVPDGDGLSRNEQSTGSRAAADATLGPELVATPPPTRACPIGRPGVPHGPTPTFPQTASLCSPGCVGWPSRRAVLSQRSTRSTPDTLDPVVRDKLLDRRTLLHAVVWATGRSRQD